MPGRRRRPLQILVLSLLLSLLPVVPAGALTSRACPTTVPSAGFRDLGGLIPDAVDAIDCVAFYNIALGTSGSAFSPNNDVLRWQMALFLTRAATAMGVNLPSGSDQGFTDLVGVGPLTTTAINQLKQLGITQGTGADTFDPFGSVPRWQMALFLIRLAATAGIPLPDGTSQGFADTAVFDMATQTAINQLRQLGITAGTGPTTFDPLSNVVRWQMALFLARQLDRGGATPYRVTIGTATPSAPLDDPLFVSIAVTNPDGTPAQLRRVDVFLGSTSATGQCVVGGGSHFNGGISTGTPCTIDSNDPLSDHQGLVNIVLSRTAGTGKDTVFAWTGEAGEVFDVEEVRNQASHVITWVESPTDLTLPGAMTQPVGTSLSITAQFLRGGSPLAILGQPVRFQISRNAAIVHDVQVLSAADGSATFTYTGPTSPATDTVTAFWDRNFNGLHDGGGEFDATTTVKWESSLP